MISRLQVATALGAILREETARDLPCGVFGSFGWSGEAVDELEKRLKACCLPSMLSTAIVLSHKHCLTCTGGSGLLQSSLVLMTTISSTYSLLGSLPMTSFHRAAHTSLDGLASVSAHSVLHAMGLLLTL